MDQTSIPLATSPGTTILYPASFAQQALWFHYRLFANETLYNHLWQVKFSGTFHPERLLHALQGIVDRHEILRTSFYESENGLIQRVSAITQIDCPMEDYADFSAEEKNPFLTCRSTELYATTFDLEHGPLFRFQLIRFSPVEHSLLVLKHHLVTDGSSWPVFLKELALLYAGEPLPPLPLQYGEYAARQKIDFETGRWELHRKHWQEHFPTAPPPLDLPADKSRPTVRSFRGGTLKRTLSANLKTELRALATHLGSSTFRILMAAFILFLNRITGEKDIVIGTALTARATDELSTSIGFFVNMAALRTEIKGNHSFLDLLKGLHSELDQAVLHQEYPFEKVVQLAAPIRELTREPLVSVSFVKHPPSREIMIGGLVIRDEKLFSTLTLRDLGMFSQETPDGILLTCEYNRDIFDTETIHCFMECYEALLRGLVTTPDQLLFELPLLSKVERHRLLVEWNDTQTEYPRGVCIHELFVLQVQRTPEAIALVFQKQLMTYRELNARANKLGHYLRNLGIGPDIPVGICIERSPDLIVGLLGILKAGGAYLPLDPELPRERLAFMVQDSGVRVILAQKRFSRQLPINCLKAVFIEDLQELTRDFTDDNPVNETCATNLAYVMYTSGSTGTPKGVEIPHRGVVRLIMGTDYVSFGQQQSFLQLAPISFDASTFELWGALLHGSRCVLYPGSIATPQQLGEIIRAEGITTLWLTSSYFNVIIDSLPEILTGVSQLLTGGEALSPHHVRKALKLLPETRIFNCYGPTESTTFACCHPVSAESADTTMTVPIGRPIANTRVYILDAHLQPVPAGLKGYLYIGGDGLARGYLNRSELTREMFISDPFTTAAGARLYNSGDLARYLPSGQIEFLGRSDSQVKIRGFRIELGEIESVLTGNPGVRSAVVITREDFPGDKRLVAYVVLQQRRSVSGSDLRHYLKQRLPAYMLPSALVFLDTIPLTANGKVDLRALPHPNCGSSDLHPPQGVTEIDLGASAKLEKLIAGHPDVQECCVVIREVKRGVKLPVVFFSLKHQKSLGASELVSYIARKHPHHFITDKYIAVNKLPRTVDNQIDRSLLSTIPFPGDGIHRPRDIVEIMLADIWQELLGTKDIGIHDNFFNSGGDSLRAVQMVTRIETDLGVRVPLGSLFENATIDTLARTMRELTASTYDSPLIRIQSGNPGRPLFFLHGDFTGGGFFCRKLARSLGEDLAFYAVQPFGLPGQPVPSSIEDMAEAYIVHILAVDPNGPYRLAGHCNGALVALEIARRLLQRGKLTELLVMIDPSHLMFSRKESSQASTIEAANRQIHSGNAVDFGSMNSEAKRSMILEMYFRICSSYVPTHFPGKLDIFLPEAKAVPAQLITHGWGKLANLVHIHTIPGNHFTIMTDHVENTAQRLRHCIETIGLNAATTQEKS